MSTDFTVYHCLGHVVYARYLSGYMLMGTGNQKKDFLFTIICPGWGGGFIGVLQVLMGGGNHDEE